MKKFVLTAGILIGGIISFLVIAFLFKDNIAEKFIAYSITERCQRCRVVVEGLELRIDNKLSVMFKSIRVSHDKKQLLSLNRLGLHLQVSNLDYRKSSIKMVIHDGFVDIDNLLLRFKLQKNQSEDTSGVKQNKRILSYSDLRFFLDVKNIKFVTKKSGVNSELIAKKIFIKEGTLNKKFDVELEWEAESRPFDTAIKVLSKTVIQVDSEKYTKENTLNLKLDSKMSTAAGGASISLGQTQLILDLNYDVSSNKLDVPSLRMTLMLSPIVEVIKKYYGKDIKVSDSAILLIQGEGEDLLNNTLMDVSFNSERWELIKIGNLDIPLTQLKGNVQVRDQQVGVSVEYGDSRFSGKAELENSKLSNVEAKGTLVIDDMASFLTLLTKEYQLKTQDSTINFSVNSDFQNDRFLPEVDIKISKAIAFESSDSYKITIPKLSILSSQAENKLSFKMEALSEISVPGRPLLFGSLKGEGQFNGKDEIRTAIKVNSWVLQRQSRTGTTNADIVIVLSKNRVSLEKINGEFYLKDVVLFVPAEIRQKLRGIDSSKAYLVFNGEFEIFNGEAVKSSLQAELKNDIRLNADVGSIEIKTLKVRFGPVTNKQYLPMTLDSVATFLPRERAVPIRMNWLSDINIDFNDILVRSFLKINIKNNVKINTQTKIANTISIEGSSIKISQIDSHFRIYDFISLIPLSQRSLFVSSDKDMSGVSIKGDIEIKNKNLVMASVVARSTQPIKMRLSKDVPASLSIESRFTNEALSYFGELSTLGGKIVLNGFKREFRNIFGINTATVFPDLIELKAKDIRMPKAFARRLLYTSNSSTEEASMKDSAKTNFSFLNGIPRFKLQIKESSFSIGNSKFSILGNFDYHDRVIESSNMKLTCDSGYGLISFKGTFADASAKMTINSDIHNVNLLSLNALLPPIVETVSGEMNGSMTAALTYAAPAKTRYKAEFESRIKKGEIRNLNLTKSIKAVIGRFEFAKKITDKLSVILTDSFEHLMVRGRADEDTIILDDFDFIGIKDAVSIKGKGYLGQLLSKKKSELLLSIADLTGEVAPIIKANTGLERIPVRLSGNEINLTPDIRYTLNEVGGSALKVQASKQIEKVRSKVLKSIEEKAGDIFGNMFGGKKKKKKK